MPLCLLLFSMLLYAKVEEFSQCHAITSVWLRCKDNSSRTGYAEVASLYIEHVMVPQGRYTLIPNFLDSCTVLESDVKQSLVEKYSIPINNCTDIDDPAHQSKDEEDSSSVQKYPRDNSQENGIQCSTVL